MLEATLLNVVLWIPVVGVALLLLVPKERDQAVRALTVIVMTLQLVVTTWLYLRFDNSATGLQF